MVLLKEVMAKGVSKLRKILPLIHERVTNFELYRTHLLFALLLTAHFTQG